MGVATPDREVYLRPGDFCFGEGRLRITTLLGSCVSVVLWHPTQAHGGMCHYHAAQSLSVARQSCSGRKIRR